MNLFKTKNWSNFFGLDDSLEVDNNLDAPMVDEESFEKEETQYSNEPSYAYQASEEKNATSLGQTSSNNLVNKKVVDMNTYQNVNDKNQRRQTENKRVHRKITVFEPRAYSDCKSIAKALFRKEIVIITFSAMEESQARRVVDFITGAIYAVDGDIQRIGEEIFICSPANVDVDSSVAQSLISTHLSNY